MSTNQKLIETLARSETFQDYERAYTEAVGMPLALRAVEPWQMPDHSRNKDNDFCTPASGENCTCAACRKLQAKSDRATRHKAAAKSCVFGLYETAVPVKLGAQIIGFLQTGRVRFETPTAAAFRRLVQQAEKLGVDIGDKRTRQAYFETPVVSRKKLAAVANLLSIFADHLAIISNQLAVQAANAEPPVIAQAKQFIREHYAEELSLSQVAGVVHMSSHYFCKQFRKATGMSYTGFVSRTRIEQAKSLLLNPNLRVSEIGYTVGFQSLNHFNRMFKKIAGQSPSHYRDELPAVA
ncbi:MAG: helix-turn-helix domain-containing protein [Verrucomicrobiae bacterium]|nr:helix-turn-helix domain-containing protein [Verrucomicrobiae bacterium]